MNKGNLTEKQFKGTCTCTYEDLKQKFTLSLQISECTKLDNHVQIVLHVPIFLLEMMQEAQDNVGDIISTVQTERQQEEEVSGVRPSCT